MYYENLKNIATMERAKSGKVYKAGATLIQISATRGQTEFHLKDGEVEAKFLVIEPKADINPEYFFISFNRQLPRFLSRYQTGLNIQPKVFEFMEIPIHPREEQDSIVNHVREVDKAAEQEEQVIEMLKTLKKHALSDMFL